MKRDPLHVRITFSRNIPVPVQECFATCIVRQLSRRRAVIAQRIAAIMAAMPAAYTGPTSAAQLTRCLDDVRVHRRNY